MSAPTTPQIVRHHAPDAHGLDGGAFHTVLTVRVAGVLAEEMTRLEREPDDEIDAAVANALRRP